MSYYPNLKIRQEVGVKTKDQKRFYAMIELLPSGCWRFTGKENFRIGGSSFHFQRAAYILWEGALRIGQ